MMHSETSRKKLSVEVEHDRKFISLDPLTVVHTSGKETEFIQLLGEYEAILESSKTAQAVVDNTNDFVKRFLGSECTCVRSAENNKELVFKTVTCPHTYRENRAYRLDSLTIITRAARNGISILERDQKDHPDNGRPDSDSGSLLTVSLPFAPGTHSARMQLTACDFKTFGMFNGFHATILNFINRRMSDAYLARRYSALHPFITQTASRMEDMASQHRMFGSSLLEDELGLMIDELQIPHNAAFLIEEPTDHPKLLQTEAPLTRGGGLRPLQEKILGLIQKEEGGYVLHEDDKVKLHRKVDQYVEVFDRPEDWPVDPGLSVAVAPIAFETEFIGYLWLERQGEPPFTPEELEKLEQRVMKKSSEVFVKAVEQVGRPRVHFVALPSNPRMKEVLDSIQSAVKHPHLNVLLVGETGTGKELAAQIIHDETRDRGGRYEAIDPATANSPNFSRLLLGSGSKGKPESVSGFLHRANGGTLVLDQLEKFPSQSLDSLLRVLAERTYRPLEADEDEIFDARVIGIVTGNLEEQQKKGPLSEEFIARLNDIEIYMPPLRERKEEIEAIVEHWLRSGELSQYVGKYVPERVIDLFKKYDWPTNLRQLRKVVDAMCRQAGPSALGELTVQHLDANFLRAMAAAGIAVDPAAG